jgi:hypothetical protein
MDILNSLFGFVSRTSIFYEKYKQFASAKVFIQAFFTKDGMKHFINLIRSVNLEHIWHIVINISAIFSISTVAANERFILSLTEGLINQFECLSGEAASIITENRENIMKFMSNMENMIDLVSSPYQKENYLDFFRNFFKLGNTKTKDPEVDSNAEIGRISLISPRNKPPAFSSRNKLGKFPSPSHRSESMRPEYSEFNETIVSLKDLIEKRHSECLKLIDTRLASHKETQDKLELVFKEHHSCDQQEFALLSTVEFLLTEDKLEEALKVIR